MEDPHHDCLIIGAGIAGLLAASSLASAGLKVRVLDKGRGLGGRMASRRRDGATFDHGAQFFTVRDSRFKVWVERWICDGIVAPWYELGESGWHFRGVPSMTGIAKHLASDLAVERELTVTSVAYSESAEAWEIELAGHQALCARSLILTPPVPQSLALLDAGGFNIPAPKRTELDSIRYHRCIAAMAILDRPSAITAHSGALKLDGEPIQWITDNQRKGISPDVPAVTIHSTPAFADSHWDSDNSERIPLLLEAARSHLKAGVISCAGHRWGFSRPTSSYNEEAYCDSTHRLAIAGDGLVGGRVEGAALSGIVAAESILSTFR